MLRLVKGQDNPVRVVCVHSNAYNKLIGSLVIGLGSYVLIYEGTDECATCTVSKDVLSDLDEGKYGFFLIFSGEDGSKVGQAIIVAEVVAPNEPRYEMDTVVTSFVKINPTKGSEDTMILRFTDRSAFPTIGNNDKFYFDITNNTLYVWNGEYVKIGDKVSISVQPISDPTGSTVEKNAQKINTVIDALK